MDYLNLSLIIIFYFAYSINCERCSHPKFKNCQIVRGSSEFNVYETMRCCRSLSEKNETEERELEENEPCIRETVFCCSVAANNMQSRNLCERSIQEIRNKTELTIDQQLQISVHEIKQKKMLTTTELPITSHRHNSLNFKKLSSFGEGFKNKENKKGLKYKTATQILRNIGKLLKTTLDIPSIKVIGLNRTNSINNESVETDDPLVDIEVDESAEISQISHNSTTTTESSRNTNSSLGTESNTKFTTIPPIIEEPTTTTARPMTKSEQKCAEYGMSTIKKVRLMPLIGQKPLEYTVDKCMHKFTSLVVGGNEAMPYEYPHQALLGYQYNDDIIWKCGGSLVSRKFILTAAHCVSDYDLGPVKKVKLGSFKQFEDTTKTITREVVRHIEHPDYDRLNLIDDIGLLELDDFVPLSEYINPICLPVTEVPNKVAIAIGFGATENSIRSRRLMKAVLEKFEPYYPPRISNETQVNKFIFFGHRTQRKDTCTGDSGSPLQVTNNKNVKCSYIQIGIVSYGPDECGIPGVPAVYVNVFYYIDWIEQYIWEAEDRLEEISKS